MHWVHEASIHVCIDQSTFSGRCGQYHVVCLHFPESFSGVQFRLGQPRSPGKFFSSATKYEIQPLTTGPADVLVSHSATEAHFCTYGLGKNALKYLLEYCV